MEKHLFYALEKDVEQNGGFMNMLISIESLLNDHFAAIKSHMEAFKELINIFDDVHKRVDQLMEMCDEKEQGLLLLADLAEKHAVRAKLYQKRRAAKN